MNTICALSIVAKELLRRELLTSGKTNKEVTDLKANTPSLGNRCHFCNVASSMSTLSE